MYSEPHQMKVYIASHKYHDVPHDALYQPLFVGAHKLKEVERHDRWEFDDSYPGNISEKNSSYCELTGLHWIWKQSREDVVGLVHYRRLFESPNKQGHLLSEAEITQILSTHDCIVAEAVPCFDACANRLMTIAEHQRRCHPGTDFTQLSRVLKRHSPSFHKAFLDLALNKTAFSPYNMIICKKELLDSYAEWLFSIETIMEDRLSPLDNRSPYQRRVFGFLSERLMNVFLDANELKTFSCSVFDPSNPSLNLGAIGSNPQVRSPQYRGQRISATKDGVNYSRAFDINFYLSHYEDLYKAFSNCPQNALDHFLEHGIEEGRIAHPCFSINSYINGNPDLWEKTDHDRRKMLLHFVKHWPFVKRTIGFEPGFYEPIASKKADPYSIAALKREAHLRSAELRGLLD